MEFLDIILTKDSSLLLHAFHSLSTGGFLKKTRLYSGFKNTYKKSAKPKNSSLFVKSILWEEKMWVENQTKTRVWEDSSLCPESSTKNAVQGFHLRRGTSNQRYGCCFFRRKCLQWCKRWFRVLFMLKYHMNYGYNDETRITCSYVASTFTFWQLQNCALLFLIILTTIKSHATVPFLNRSLAMLSLSIPVGVGLNQPPFPSGHSFKGTVSQEFHLCRISTDSMSNNFI